MTRVRESSPEKKPTLVLGVPFLLFAAGCGQRVAEDAPVERSMPDRTIEEVLKQHTDSLVSLPGVAGPAQGERSGQPGIRGFVAERTPVFLKKIPSEIAGYELAVQDTGEIKALDPS